MGVTRIDQLADAERARFDEWADRWTAIGLRTGPADRATFEAAVQECYRFAGIPWPGVVVWVPSPLVLALAAPAAALAIEAIKALKKSNRPAASGVGRVETVTSALVRGAVRDAVGDAVDDAVGGAVRDAVRGAVRGAVDDAVRGAVRGAVDDAVRGAVGDAVGDAVDGAVGDAVRGAVRDAVRGAVRDAVGDAVRDAVDDAVDGAVDDAVRDAVDGAVRGAVDDAVRDAVDDAVGDAVRDAVGDAVDGAVGDAVRGAVDGAVGGAVRGAVDDAVRGAVGDAVGDAVRGAVDDAVRGGLSVLDGSRDAIVAATREVISRSWTNYFGGQFWVGGGWLGGAWTSFFREVCKLELQGDLWDRAKAYEGTMESACWWWPHREFVMVCERPTVIQRELADPARSRGWGSHRLHCDDGPAVAWPDGWGVWAIHGVRVTRQIVEAPATLTSEQILTEPNAEVRRIMLERFGFERFLTDSGARSLQHDEVGELYRIDIPDDEPLVVVKVRNSTPEPDGSFKDYVLRVPPDTTTARGGIAWSFGLEADAYQPAVET